MALSWIGSARDNAPLVRGDGVFLRPAVMTDFDEWVRLREASRAFLSPWEPTWPADDLTRGAFRRRVKRHTEEIERDESYAFLLFRDSDERLLGGLTLGQVRRGVAQASTIGYWMGAPFAGRGYMARGLRAAVSYSFSTLRLHRLEAACLPSNDRSIRLLEAVGFGREGLARSYLCIDGRWRDHLLFSILEGDPVLAARRGGGERPNGGA